VVGDMALYVQSLSQQLAKHEFETHVITYNEDLKGVQEETSGVTVHRIGNPVKTHLNIITWVLTLSQEFERICADIHYDIGPIDLLDCQEWITVPAACSLSKALGIPYVMTIHSLEEQRAKNPDNPASLTIRHFERLGTHNSSRIIVASPRMKEEVQRLHNVPETMIEIVPQPLGFGKKISETYANAVKTWEERKGT
jgi:glycosyltransferase involved in cell wall biosynthesis